MTELNRPVDPLFAYVRRIGQTAMRRHVHNTEPIVDKKGNVVVCPNCQGTGYLGRTAIYEILVVDDQVKALLTKGADLQRIKEHYRKRRTHDLWRAGLQKVFDGDTSLDEVLRVLRGNSK